MATGALRDVVQNIMDGRIPQEVKERLLKPLHPGKCKPIPPSRKKKERKRKAILEEFDPYLPRGNQTITNHQNEFLGLYDALEGVEQEGRRFIRWVLSKDLEGNLTPSIIAKFKNKKKNTAFYIRYIYSYIIENIEDGRSMVFL